MDILEFLKKAEGGEQYVDYVTELRSGRNKAEKELRDVKQIQEAIGDRPVQDLISNYDWMKQKFPKGPEDIIQLEAKANGTEDKIKQLTEDYERQKLESDAKYNGIAQQYETARKRADVIPSLLSTFGSELKATMIFDKISGSLIYGEDGNLYRKDGDKTVSFSDSLTGIKEAFNELLPKADGSQLPPNNGNDNSQNSGPMAWY